LDSSYPLETGRKTAEVSVRLKITHCDHEGMPYLVDIELHTRDWDWQWGLLCLGIERPKAKILPPTQDLLQNQGLTYSEQ